MKRLALIPIALLFLAACGSSEPAGQAASSSKAASGSQAGSDSHDSAADCTPTGDPTTAKSHVAATLEDFKITLASTSAPAGTIAFDAKNTSGTHPHEIVVVKGVAPDALPRGAEGDVDEDKLPAGALIGELEAFAAGKACSGAFELATGSYTLFCNVVAEEGAHAMLGMITTFDVK